MYHKIQKYNHPLNSKYLNKSFFHSGTSSKINDINNNGWNPEEGVMVIYGTGMYFTDRRWGEYTDYVECYLNLKTEEVFNLTPHNQNDLIQYLKANGISTASKTAYRGNHKNNIAIKNYFLNHNFKAIRFMENDFDVIEVFDLRCIYVVGEGKW